MAQQLQILRSNLEALGTRRLITLGVALLATFAAIAAVSLYAAQPTYETLYSGLERDDINRIGPVLGEAGIAYDVDAEGGTVLVAAGRGAQARMILAEQGLPRSQGSGYELLDRMGSLGLTSFMQQMTRVRALEGEIARSVRSMQGVRSARVHIMLPDRSSFADRARRATASVLLTTDRRMNSETAASIRHLVSAAVPQLATDDVSVLDASGRLLASGKANEDGTGNGMSAVQAVEARLAEKIRRVLEPRLGPDAFRVAVQATLDLNERRTESTTFDPDSRVERSVRVVRSQELNTEQADARNTSVAADLPEATGETVAGPSSNQSNERREETTNFEINSTKTATVRRGFEVARLSASIVVDRAQLERMAGGSLDATTLQARLDAIRRNVIAAGGFDATRDTIEIEADTFVPIVRADAASGPSVADRLLDHTGTIARSVGLVAVVLAVLLLGMKPLARMAFAAPEPLSLAVEPSQQEGQNLLDAPGGKPEVVRPAPRMLPSPQERLQALVDADEEKAANVLRAWLADDSQSTGIAS